MRSIRGRASRPRKTPGQRLRELRQTADLMSCRELAQDIRRKVGQPVGHNMLTRMELDGEVHPKYWRRVSQYFGEPLGPRTALQASRAGIVRGLEDRAQMMWEAQQVHGYARGRALAEQEATAATNEGEADEDLEADTITSGDEDELPELVDELHRVIPRNSNFQLSYASPDLESRQRTMGVLSNMGSTPYELEALIFVAAVTHCLDAMNTYAVRPEDYRGRVAALHEAIDDADRYARAEWLVEASVGEPQVAAGHRPDRTDYPAYLRSIQRWLTVHGPTLHTWADGVGPWWDTGLTDHDASRLESDPSLMARLRDYWKLSQDAVDSTKFAEDVSTAAQ